MKLKNISFYLFIFVFMYVQIPAQNTNPVVSNVEFSISGTTVTVTYDVSDAEQSTVTIIMQVSNDGGTTWSYSFGATSGDIGAGVSTGTGKTITWTYNDVFAENFKMKIIANDEIADGSPCPGTPTVEYSGKTYNTIQIADKCWLKENLDVGTRINGSVEQTNNSTIEKYCNSDNTNNCDTYGGLYQWDELMQYSTTSGTQGICPAGWHIPTNAEFETLIETAGSSSNALKAVGQGTGGGAGTNTSGFSAFLAGSRIPDGSYTAFVSTYYWGSDRFIDPSTAFLMFLNNNNDVVSLLIDNKTLGSSVRCCKD